MIHVQEYGAVSSGDHARKKQVEQEKCCREIMAVVCIVLLGCFCIYIVLLIIVIMVNNDALFGIHDLDGSG